LNRSISRSIIDAHGGRPWAEGRTSPPSIGHSRTRPSHSSSNPVTAAGRAALAAAITQQAQIIAYVNDYKLLMIASIAGIQLLIALKKPADDQSTIIYWHWNDTSWRRS
jgi:hypothetical protein